MSGGNDRDGIDQSTSFWLDRGGGDGDPITQSWSDERERVAADPDVDDWKGRDNEDLEQATVAAIDESRSRQTDREDWAEARQYRDFVTERWPGTKIPDYIASRLQWNEAFRQNPARAQELWVREWNARSPFRDQPKPRPKAEPPPDLTRDGLEEWTREQDVRNAIRSAGSDRADADDFEMTADLRALIKEKTGLSPAKFLERCCAVDEASFNDPYSVASRFARFNGMPATQAHADEMVATVQQAQATEAVGGWLDGLKAQGRLAPDYDLLERDVGDVLLEMNSRGMRTDNIEQDLDTAIQWARDRYLARQQQANAPTQLEGVMRTAGLPSLADHVEKARRASRSVSGAPSAGGAGPAIRRRGMSYDDELRADVAAAVRG